MTLLAPPGSARAVPPAPEQAQPIPSFAAHLAEHGDRVAVLSGEQVITYAELDSRVRSLSAELGADRRLALIGAGNTIDSLVAYLAALRAGHPVLLTAGDHHSMRSLGAIYDPDVVIAACSNGSVDERRPSSAHRLHPDLALLLSTSGSTGSPKLVRLSRRNLQANAESVARYLAITPNDRAATTLPMQYCYGLSVINSHLHAGASLVLTDLSVVDRCFWELFDAAKVTSFAGVPHTFELLDRVGFESMSLPSLRYLTQAGGRLRPDLVRRYAGIAERDGWELFVMYGQTEATARMAYVPPTLAASHPHSIGIAIPGGSLTIECPDEDGVGELVYRGANVMLGYAENLNDLAQGATVDVLRTGDLARVTDEGLYELVGRLSRFIKLFGLRVDLDQIERLLNDHGIVAMCTGNDERIIVAVDANTDPTTIGGLISDHLELPRAAICTVGFAELPRLGNGKPDYGTIHRRALVVAREREAKPQSTDSSNRDHETAVRAAFAEVLGIADPCDADTFVSLGGDSLSYVEMSIRLEPLLRELPRDWHLTPIARLAPGSAGHRRLAAVETSVVLRAVAIVLVVFTHTGLWHLPGGAHTLLGIAGYNFARFQLRAHRMAASIARIALPAMCWIGIVAATTDDFAWTHALLLNGVIGSPDARWSYWYIEAIVLILLGLAPLFAVRTIRLLEQRRPFGFALVALAAGLAARFALTDSVGAPHRGQRPQDVFWLFALGWVVAQSTTTRQRLLVSAITATSLPGFFGDTQREMIVAIGLLLVLWVPSLPLPRRSTPLVGMVAGASLYIYLTHWQVYPPLIRHGPASAAAGSLFVGVLAWQIARRLSAAVESALPLRTARARRNGTSPAPSCDGLAARGRMQEVR